MKTNWTTAACFSRLLDGVVGDYPSFMNVAADIKTVADGLVVSNPGILGGTPVFLGTRLPVKTLFEYLADGLSLDYFLDSFEGVTREQATRVLRFGWEAIAAQLAAR